MWYPFVPVLFFNIGRMLFKLNCKTCWYYLLLDFHFDSLLYITASPDFPCLTFAVVQLNKKGYIGIYL